MSFICYTERRRRCLLEKLSLLLLTVPTPGLPPLSWLTENSLHLFAVCTVCLRDLLNTLFCRVCSCVCGLRTSCVWGPAATQWSLIQTEAATPTGLLLLVGYVCHEPWLVSHETPSSSAECSWDKPPFNFIRGQDSTMWGIIRVRRKNTDQCLKVTISFCRHHSVPVLYKNGWVETTVAEGGQNPVAGLWGRTLGGNWPPEPTSSYASIDFWCQLVASPATASSWMSIIEMVGVPYVSSPWETSHAKNYLPWNLCLSAVASNNSVSYVSSDVKN